MISIRFHGSQSGPYLIMAPSLLITIGILIPFGMAIFYSLTNYSFRLPKHSFVGLRNWINMFTDRAFWHAVWVTVRFAFFATILEMLLGLGIALLLGNTENKFTKVLRVVLTFPLMVAPVIGTIIWQLMTNNSVGILEKFLNLFGIYNFPWAASHATAMFTAVLIPMGLLSLCHHTPCWYSPFPSRPLNPQRSMAEVPGSLKVTHDLSPAYMSLLFRLMASCRNSRLYLPLQGGPEIP